MTDTGTRSPLLTESEAIAWLRLDGPSGPKNPAGTLKYYRDHRLLRAVRISRTMMYPVWELERFLHRLAEREGGVV